MKDSAHPKNLPWIMWLLRVLSSDSRASDAKLFQDAEDNGLITKTETPLWNVDRNWAKSLPSKISTARDLKTPDDVANFIMAMAELSARCNELSIKESQAKLREAKSTKQLARVFDLIGEWTNKHCLPADPNLDELATVKWIQGCKWNHESLRSVSWLVDHPSRLRLFDRWGLALGVRIAASLNFREFGIWLAKQTDASIVSPALYTLPELAFWGDEDISVGLLSSGNVFLELLGVASLHFYQHEPTGPKWKFSLEKAFRLIDSSGINLEEAVWTSFTRIQDMHSMLQNREARILEYKSNEHITRDAIDRLEEEHASLNALFTQALETFISHYPEKGISPKRAEYIIQSARGQVDLAINIAEGLPTKSCQSLLEAIVKRVDSDCRLSEPIDANQSYSLPHDWKTDIPIAAKAHALSYSGVDVERMFSRKVEKPEKALLPYVSQPYLANRRHYLWTHVFGRLAVIYLYAFEVAYENKKEDSEKKSFLESYVSKQAITLLKSYHGEGTLREIFDRLSLHVASVLCSDESVENIKLRNELINHPSAYSVTKLYTLWSSQELLEGNEELAFTLLIQLGMESKGRDDRASLIGIYVDLIDRALTISTKLGRPELTRKVLDAWDASFSNWEDLIVDKWAQTPHNVAKALSGDQIALDWLSKQEEFERSASKAYCDAHFKS